MKRISWQLALAAFLVIASVLLYLSEILIFNNPRDTFFYLFQDLAFVPIQVLLVTLILNSLLTAREKRTRLEKLSLVIGAFFSEMGTQLLTFFSDHDPNLDQIKKELVITDKWTDGEFLNLSKRLKGYDYGIEIHAVDLNAVHAFLVGKRDFLIRLFENPYLLEHEAFTDMLRAVLHLTEELAARKELTKLPESDLMHLAGDIKRAYTYLVLQWVDYMKYLKAEYPYLFSLAMRTNPFDEKASATVTPQQSARLY